MNAHRIAIVDDDLDLLELLSLRLAGEGFLVTVLRTLEEARQTIEGDRFDVVLLDLRLPDGDGMTLLRSLADRGVDTPVVIMTAHGTIDGAVEALRVGADDFVTKPFVSRDLLAKLRGAAERARLRRDARTERLRMAEDPHHLVGISEAIARVRERIEKIASTDATVLVTGESGTGKELVARALHARSARANHRFVALNCAAVPDHLVEGELFGHARGAFTDAHRDRPGLVAAAEGSTLFLDEVGDAPLTVQAKLLRLLEQRTYRPVGATHEVTADVRIIAATNRDLVSSVAAGRVRADLMYRLRVVPIELPPLRERREDIPLLATVFAGCAAARHGVPERPLSPQTIEQLVAYDWPGNVRELSNLAERAAVCGQELTLDDGPEPMAEVAPEVLPPLRAARAEFERTYVEQVLRATNGNVAAAARIARRNRSEFYAIMKRHEIAVRNRGGGAR